MSAKRALLLVFSIFVGILAVPHTASALSFTPSQGSPIRIAPPDDVLTDAAVCLNAAHSAYAIRQEVEEAGH